ncbi:MAG TPA: thioredoxin family protein [Nevskiaceae bacterium]|nr:thioredoxin family protein [Nevskiaceae bacterium]
MALTPSSMLPLGTKAPAFSLPDTVTGTAVSLDAAKGNAATVVMFICNHCPYVKHVNAELVRVANDYRKRGVGFVAISSNDAKNYPEDAPEKMKENARANAYPFPYLYDESQAVAKSYQAACTPDFFVFDRAMHLVYRGRLDESTPGNGKPLTGADLRMALEALLNDKPVSPDQSPSMGCNIKWRKAA